jgi:hypothetical protein
VQLFQYSAQSREPRRRVIPRVVQIEKFCDCRLNIMLSLTKKRLGLLWCIAVFDRGSNIHNRLGNFLMTPAILDPESSFGAVTDGHIMHQGAD